MLNIDSIGGGAGGGQRGQLPPLPTCRQGGGGKRYQMPPPPQFRRLSGMMSANTEKKHKHI